MDQPMKGLPQLPRQLLAERDRQRPQRIPLGELTLWNTRFAFRPGYPLLPFRSVPTASQLRGMDTGGGDVALLGCGLWQGSTTVETAGEWLNEGEVILFPQGGNAYCIRHFNGKFCTANTHIGQSRCPSVITTAYLALWMEENASAIDRLFNGVGIRQPDMKRILSLRVDVPSVEYQCKAVAFLNLCREMLHEQQQNQINPQQRMKIYQDECFSEIIQRKP